ncbi:hypothetical protein [Rhodoferax sp.]|uniref:hypothetical protein n=1 Tax=Rhodoferax sp. TaxID=50421 RepID=UPI0027226983|nr:hypothetical protein [Rhodoferax sp.]MDO9196354.1 hypothetical protein [Rhodoferax sp.]
MTHHLTSNIRRAKAGLIFATLASASLLLGACASKPVPPDWQANAFEALKGYSSAYLSGNTRLADFEFARARSEIARTGRADLMARAELTRCATRVASLEFDNCAAYQPLAADAGAAEQAYAAFLTNNWTGLNAALLPEQHRPLVLSAAADKPASSPAQAVSVLDTIKDPLARLVAAGVLLQGSRLTPADIAVATETASTQGWRRPLLAWLGVQHKRADGAGDRDAAVRIQRRIDLVLQLPPKTQ